LGYGKPVSGLTPSGYEIGPTGVGVDVNVGVKVGVFDGVNVGVNVGVGVRVGVFVSVNVGVLDGVSVSVDVAVGPDGVFVAKEKAVGDGVFVPGSGSCNASMSCGADALTENAATTSAMTVNAMTSEKRLVRCIRFLTIQ